MTHVHACTTKGRKLVIICMSMQQVLLHDIPEVFLSKHE